MYCSGQFRVLLLTAAMLLPGTVFVLAQSAQSPDKTQADNTEVHLRWGARPGVARYRLQLASDSAFADIVFDRVIAGNDYEIKDLFAGRYFWRVAPLTGKLGEFSSAGSIEVRKQTLVESLTPLQKTRPINDSSGTNTASLIIARGGWRAAVGDIAHPLLAHLRSPASLDLVGINSEGVMFALDASSGVALWSTGRGNFDSTRAASGSSAVLLARSRSGLDNLVVLAGVNVTAIEGVTGRELWRTTLPAAASSGTIVSDNRSAKILVVDNSSPRLFVLDANNGHLLNQVRLPHRVVGGPVTLLGQGRVVFAYDTGQVEIRDFAGAVVRSGDAGSPATTAPLFIKDRRGDFILLGTRGGLTALAADELSPLGMVAIKDDAPRGALAAADLNGDGSPEVIMMTDRGRVIAVSGADGKILWEATVGNEGQSVAFADIDGDRVLDVVLAGGQSFALALSGRDGSVVWKDNEAPVVVANHSVALAPRSIVAMPYGSGALLIAADPARTGLRAVEFPKGSAPLNH
ncbi:MAG TPA: PQQ-binding-like beta-propeller repeat protein [Pyrinomonadaceae bacterium]|nr:PQQ-binding-like beta-propeller repeat protein [Pyrinomonadaceae bacterium]